MTRPVFEYRRAERADGGYTFHLTRQDADSRTLCGRPTAGMTLGDETVSGIAATCGGCRRHLPRQPEPCLLCGEPFLPAGAEAVCPGCERAMAEQEHERTHPVIDCPAYDVAAGDELVDPPLGLVREIRRPRATVVVEPTGAGEPARVVRLDPARWVSIRREVTRPAD